VEALRPRVTRRPCCEAHRRHQHAIVSSPASSRRKVPTKRPPTMTACRSDNERTSSWPAEITATWRRRPLELGEVLVAELRRPRRARASAERRPAAEDRARARERGRSSFGFHPPAGAPRCRGLAFGCRRRRRGGGSVVVRRRGVQSMENGVTSSPSGRCGTPSPAGARERSQRRRRLRSPRRPESAWRR
jgi:hypothetical protein